jgi:hypothetical protein
VSEPFIQFDVFRVKSNPQLKEQQPNVSATGNVSTHLP